ncbi:hypothetical protein GEV33_011989 [Tenebrio molitor]|uniref:Uncharacterized protein n=1 Tax=Tenebrio molitor TaxID=7067 RepID=A0A8J6L8H6_TENMO|nr:hypothetical protein GEV33_011989 [Tenebrio molitor]
MNIRRIVKLFEDTGSVKELPRAVTKLLRKRSRWRKNSVLSPSRARKLARSRLPQPCPPNPPRNPCFFRPTIPGLRAEQSSPTATALVSEPGHPAHPLSPARSLPQSPPDPVTPPQPRHTPTGSLATPSRGSTPPRGSSRADRRKYEHPLIFLAAEDIPQVTGTIPGGSRLHQVVPLVHSVNKGFATTVCLFPPLPRALTADPWTPSLRRATPAVWRPTTAEKRDWRSRHTATDRRQIASRDVTTGSRGRGHLIQWPPRSPDLTPLDFFLWGYVKEIVFQEIPTTREDMMERIQQAFAAIRRETLRNVRRRFYSRIERESGSWLHAIPSPNIGTLLDNTSFQVCIGLRLGCDLCTPHICKCNAKVDEIGTHSLSCFKSSGRFSRHTEINSIINRSLTSIHVNSTLEPNGLSRDDGKRPDGMTLVPWIKDQPLVWDVTVVDTLADSYVLKSSEVSGFAAEMACKRKHSKYSSIISSNYVFKGLAFETFALCPWCKEAIDFINVIGNRLIAESGDSKSKKFLFKRISLAIQLPGESQGDSDRVNLQGRRDDVVEFTRAVGDDSSKYHRPHRQADHGLHYGRFQTERFCGSGSRRVLSVQVVPGLTGRCRIYPPATLVVAPSSFEDCTSTPNLEICQICLEIIACLHLIASHSNAISGKVVNPAQNILKFVDVLADNSTECFKNKLTQSPIFVTPLKDFKDKIQGCYDDLIEELENCLPEGEKDWPQINFDMVYSLIDFSYENKDQLISSKFRNYFMNCVENFHDAEAKVELMRCFSGNESNSLEIKKMCEMMTGVEKCTITQLDKTCPTDGSMDTLKVKFFAALREPCTEYMMTENLTDNIFKVLASYTPPNLNNFVTVRKYRSVRFLVFADLAGVEGPWVLLMLEDAPSLLEHLESNLKIDEFSKLLLTILSSRPRVYRSWSYLFPPLTALFIYRNTWRRSLSTVLIDDRRCRDFGPFVLIFQTYLGPAFARRKL